MDFDDFVAVMSRMARTADEEANELSDAFKQFDKNNDGMVSVNELRDTLTTKFEKLTEEDFNEMIKEAPVDLNNNIKYSGETRI